MSKIDNNALLSLILSEIRSNVYLLEPILKESSSSPGALNAVPEYEKLLTCISDGLELCRPSYVIEQEPRALDIPQIADDFSQAYVRRFGAGSSSGISFLIDPHLPKVKSHPDMMIKIIDCLVRAAQRDSSKSKVELIIRASKKRQVSENLQETILICEGIPYAGNQATLEKLFYQFEKRDYLKFVRDCGIELCTALHIAKNLGATIYLEPAKPGFIMVEIRFLLEKLSAVVEEKILPKTLFVYSQSEFFKKTLQKFAYVHSCEAVFVSNPGEVPKDQYLIYDALDTKNNELEELKALPNPSRTTLVLPNSDVLVWRELSSVGFKNFTCFPFVSTKLVDCLLGVETYIKPSCNAEAAANRKLRVLIVDDAATARIVLRDFFESEGHGVTEAADGSEFVSLIKGGERFDVIFCDLTMNHMDGVTAVKLVRELESKAARKTPIVLMTAYAAADAEARAQESQFDRVLYKPVLVSHVKAILKEMRLTKTAVQDRPLPKEAPVETQLIDLEDLRVRCSGKTAIMLKVLESFVGTSQSYLPRLSATRSHADRIIIVKITHTLKGLFRDVGAKKAADQIEQLERRMQDANYDIAPDLKLIARLIKINCDNATLLTKELQKSF